MQLAADFYVFELRERVAQPQRWDLIGAFLGLGGEPSASRLEREFLSPMTALALAFPPDEGGDDMQDSLQAFRRAMGAVSTPFHCSGMPNPRLQSVSPDALLAARPNRGIFAGQRCPT